LHTHTHKRAAQYAPRTLKGQKQIKHPPRGRRPQVHSSHDIHIIIVQFSSAHHDDDDDDDGGNDDNERNLHWRLK